MLRNNLIGVLAALIMAGCGGSDSSNEVESGSQIESGGEAGSEGETESGSETENGGETESGGETEIKTGAKGTGSVAAMVLEPFTAAAALTNCTST
ncbi:hypothetical protein FE845_09245 [Marinobacter sp. 1-4A]|uniref:hypothetical protein n=1 Tax=Marinobacter sp. 1-4A TaxID=2582919 RepID=UPI00190733D9|nr:hypothetical protein [Marinobacter sp. 1-4A]MBK1851525.1 hypothetical protein [Marinobacter sp. 1-4A]